MGKEWLQKLYADGKLVRFLRCMNVLATFLCAAAFVAGAVLLFLSDGVVRLLDYLFFTAFPFLLVSFLRRMICAPRPFEKYGLEPPFAQKKGYAFPSRHVFSAFLIGSTLCFVSLPLGIGTLFVGMVIAALRFLLGCHSMADILAGGLLGILAGIVGGLFL